MSRQSRTNSPNKSRINRLLVACLAAGLSVPALAQSVPFPTYSPGENTSATTGPTYSQPLPNPWVVSDGAIITPAGTQVYLGITTRAKAVALNPTGNHTAAVLQMGAPQAVTIFNTQTGAVLQTYSTRLSSGLHDPDGSPPASPIRRMASTCCSARTAITAHAQLRCHRQRQSDDGLALRLRPSQRSDGRQRRRLSDQRHLLPREQPSAGNLGQLC